MMKSEQHGGEIPESPQFPGQPNLSPHGADSNPGLVSDHEDEDDHGSASEEEDTAPQPAAQMHRRPAFAVGPGNRNCADNMDIPVDVVVQDIPCLQLAGMVFGLRYEHSGGRFADQEALFALPLEVMSGHRRGLH